MNSLSFLGKGTHQRDTYASDQFLFLSDYFQGHSELT
jgi:hypothetical protein